MHVLKFSSIAVLGCIAMVGAVPVGNRAPAEAIVGRQKDLNAINGLGTVLTDKGYVPLYCSCSTWKL